MMIFIGPNLLKTYKLNCRVKDRDDYS